MKMKMKAALGAQQSQPKTHESDNNPRNWGNRWGSIGPRKQRSANVRVIYAPNHVETIKEFKARGGQITTVTPSPSYDRLEWPAHIATLLGYTDADQDRGFSWSDVGTQVRSAVRAPSDVVGEEPPNSRGWRDE